MAERFDVVVIGGGIGGLVAARTAAGQGKSVCLIEASERFGGALQGKELGGITVDVGAEAFAIARPETRDLVGELGLSERIVQPRRSDSRLVVPNGIFPMPHALLGIPTNPLADDVVAIIGAHAAQAAAELDAAPVPGSWDSEVTLGALIRERLGDPIAELIATPVVGGVHALNPDLAEAEALIPGICAATRKHNGLAAAAAAMRAASGVPGAAVNGLRGGMSGLVTALVEDVRARGVDLRLGTAATAVTQEGATWVTHVHGGDLHSDQVVVAVDAHHAASLLTTIEQVHAPLSRLHVGDVVVFATVISHPLLDEDPLGSGALIAPTTPNIRAKAITHASAKWQWIREAYGTGRHVVRLSYGRDGVITESLDDLPAIAHQDLELLLGTSLPEFEDVHLARWTGSLLHPRVGHRANVAELRSAIARFPGLAVAPAGLAGNGLAGTISQAQASIVEMRN
ncbi:MAG: protoporphyrinogen oxidase [Candidatus Nanopelagicales bacterium]